MSLKEFSKQYILLASIYTGSYSMTPFEMTYRVYPGYVHVEYDEHGFLLKYKQEQYSFSYADIESLELSVCGRRATIRQSYAFTIHMKVKDWDLEIETYDFDDAMIFCQRAPKEVFTDRLNLISLYQKLKQNPKMFYQYLNKHNEDIFKDCPQDRRRIDFVRKSRAK